MNKLSLTLSILLLSAFGYGQKSGDFTITTDPSSAKVSLTEFPDIVKTSPANFSNYKPILYRVLITKRNYQALDTIIHCLPGRLLTYHFQLIPKSGIANIISSPSGAKVFINHEQVGITPIANFTTTCGPTVITLINKEGVTWQQNYIIDEELPVLVSHDFNTINTPVNKSYSSPVSRTDEYIEHGESSGIEQEQTYGGFGAVGFYAMLGSNGAKGTTYRYGADLFYYLRIWGESNKKSDIKGFGLEGVLPLDLHKAALYMKGGFVSRTFKPLNTYSTESITFATIGGGICIKPNSHFQIFGEFEFGMYDEEENQETIDLWKQKYNSFSSAGGWIGIRLAF